MGLSRRPVCRCADLAQETKIATGRPGAVAHEGIARAGLQILECLHAAPQTSSRRRLRVRIPSTRSTRESGKIS